MLPCGNNLIVSYTSYLILKKAAPEVKPHILYALAYGGNRDTMGVIAGIDYGPVSGIFGQYAYLPGICEGGSEYPVTFWRRLLSDEERADEDILHDAWKGRGNMWVFVRPDRYVEEYSLTRKRNLICVVFSFPIAETLATTPLPKFPYPINTEPTSSFQIENLPPDTFLSICEFLPIRSIYTLITTCKIFRSIILPHANPIARRRLIDDEPWYLPAGPLKLNSMNTNGDRMHGREEIEWWAERWAAGGIAQGDMDTDIPWFVYRKECSKSMSMWNRKRIWGISKQLDGLARVKGLL